MSTPAIADIAARLEQLLRDARLRALAEVAAGAAHEVNTPLAIIAGQAQFLLRTEVNDERAHALERIITQTGRVHALLKDLLIFARPPQPRCRTIKLRRLLAKALAAVKEAAHARQVSLRADERSAPITLTADSSLLEAALGCLLRNAIEAAPSGGWAALRWETPTPNQVAIVIEDNGPGLTAAQREHLFDPFFSGRPAGRGAGLGLCKVWRIAQLHHGDIQFTSEPGQPTRFLLTLPATVPAPRRHLRLRPASKIGKVSRNGNQRVRSR